MDDAFDYSRALAVTLLNRLPSRTAEVVREQVRLACQMARVAGKGDVDADALVAQLLHETNIYVPDATLMEDPTDHHEWLPGKRGIIDWRFWSRYREFLEQHKHLPEPSLVSLGRLTDDILARLEDPGRVGEWDCRGMVVGSVQSGKTANYCGLICKAIDSGYRLIVVLAGMHKNLRSQTQFRIDEGVIGRDSKKDRHLDQTSSLLGVGELFRQTLPIHSLTSSLDDGDFQAPKADMNVTVGSDPVVLVLKKNVSVLKNLLDWVLHVLGEKVVGSDRKIVRNVPLLLIDDEADNASINTKDRRGRLTTAQYVTAINGSIRGLLDAFEKKAYVGYTATPFANIFINPEAETPTHGEDLFPRSFILNVSPPSNYVGPSRVFGLDGDLDAGIEPREGLPLVRTVKDHVAIFPAKHKKDLKVGALPESLKLAMRSFVLVCAARRARSQGGGHNSMLVHVSRFVDVQRQVAQHIQAYLESMRLRLKVGEGERAKGLREELRELWEQDFSPTTQNVQRLAADEELLSLDWAQVAPELAAAVSRIEIREIHGEGDALDYNEHKHGLSVIAIGGDKLARGLTLEGLSISYFLRTTQMYDTLMQMGRWFGYRPGYLDLCRLFTTDDLRLWYRHIALAEVELRREFDRMKAAGLTPRRYGLRIRQHPGGLLVTAMNKMSHATTRRLSYAGQLVQTSAFSTNRQMVRRNQEHLDEFLLGLGPATEFKQFGSAWIWREVLADRITEGLLPEFSVSPESWRLQKPELMEFIRRQSAAGETAYWTIALVNTAGKAGMLKLGGHETGRAERSPETDSWPLGTTPGVYRALNSNIQSPTHQAIDLALMDLNNPLLEAILAKRSDEGGMPLFGPEEATLLRQCSDAGTTLFEAAKQLSQYRAQKADGSSTDTSIRGEVTRQLRPKSHGLLLIYPVVPTENRWPDPKEAFMGLAFCFPSSHTARSVDYRVNRVWEDVFQDRDYADDD